MQCAAITQRGRLSTLSQRRQCTRTATHRHNGQGYCVTHYPATTDELVAKPWWFNPALAGPEPLTPIASVQPRADP